MAVDYDVVIIGGLTAGRYAAIAAAQLRATVALVEPEEGRSPIWPHALTELGRVMQQQRLASQFGIHSLHEDSGQNCESLLWSEAMQWAKMLVSNLEEQNSPAVLAALGVDVIVGSGQFERQAHLAFAVNGRRLRARSFLIATGSRQWIPDIEGLETTGYLTAPEVWQSLAQPNPPQRWAIVGGDPVGIQMAQTLSRLGLNVTLVLRRSHILPQEDPDIAQLVQATLEAEGVRVLTATPVTQMKRIEGTKWLQAGDEAIETDEILLAAGQQPNVENLNLEAVGVKWNRRGLQLNKKLQTTNPRIYACGDVISGYQFTNIANYEAKIALKNALFFPVFKVDYRSLPWAIFCDPQMVRVGLTEEQARRKHGKNILVLRQYFKTLAAAQLHGETTGLCKLIVLRNGEILGAALVGLHAGELVNVFSLALAQKLKVAALATLSPVYPTMSEIFDQIATEYRQASLTNNTFLQNCLEGFFNLRRT